MPCWSRRTPSGASLGGDDVAGEADLLAALGELPPDVRAAGHVVAERVVVGERVPEEVQAVDPAVDRRRLVRVAHHRQRHGDVRVDREAGGDAAVGLDPLVVGVDPVLRLLGLDEGEGERPEAALARHQHRLAPAARHPERGVGLLRGLRDDVTRRHREPATVVARERDLDEHAGDRVERLFPLRALLLDAEPSQLHLRAALARAELDPSAGEPVERRHPLGDACRMVDRGRQLDDAVPEADALRPLRCGGEKHLGSARHRVLVEEMVLDLPDAVEAEAVGELDLLERLVQDPALVRALAPGDLVGVEEAEAHGRSGYRSQACPREPIRTAAWTLRPCAATSTASPGRRRRRASWRTSATCPRPPSATGCAANARRSPTGSPTCPPKPGRSTSAAAPAPGPRSLPSAAVRSSPSIAASRWCGPRAAGWRRSKASRWHTPTFAMRSRKDRSTSLSAGESACTWTTTTPPACSPRCGPGSLQGASSSCANRRCAPASAGRAAATRRSTDRRTPIASFSRVPDSAACRRAAIEGYDAMSIAGELVVARRRVVSLPPAGARVTGALTWWGLRAAAPLSFGAAPRVLDRLGAAWPPLRNHFFRASRPEE